jgi:hypothetical protein
MNAGRSISCLINSPIGYNYELNNLVLGIEADIDGTTGRTSSGALLSNFYGPLAGGLRG